MRTGVLDESNLTPLVGALRGRRHGIPLTNPTFEGGNFMMRRLQFLLWIAVLPIAVSAFGDTITLRDGTRYGGALVAGSPTKDITFRDQEGISHHFAMKNVQSLQFSSSTGTRFLSQPGRSTSGSTSLGAYKITPSGTELALRTNETIDSPPRRAKLSAVMDRDILDWRCRNSHPSRPVLCG